MQTYLKWITCRVFAVLFTRETLSLSFAFHIIFLHSWVHRVVRQFEDIFVLRICVSFFMCESNLLIARNWKERNRKRLKERERESVCKWKWNSKKREVWHKVASVKVVAIDKRLHCVGVLSALIANVHLLYILFPLLFFFWFPLVVCFATYLFHWPTYTW